MSEIRPIKRRSELQSLSREHHESLLFVWKIRQGLEKKIEIERLRAFVLWHFENHLLHHFQQEETNLFPYLPEHPLMKRMITEHELIKKLVQKIGLSPTREEMSDLAILMDKHIRFEERELFQFLEANLSDQHFQKIQLNLEQSSSIGECGWQDEFWLLKK